MFQNIFKNFSVTINGSVTVTETTKTENGVVVAVKTTDVVFKDLKVTGDSSDKRSEGKRA